MPEYILDHGSIEGARTFHSLDEFTQGYIEALFFTATDWDDKDDGDNPNQSPDWSVDMLAPEALAAIIADCARFQAERRVDLDEVCDQERIKGYDEAQAGRDFLYSRNRHGCGFWEIDGAAADSLNRFAHTFSESSNLYLGEDGKLYIE